MTDALLVAQGLRARLVQDGTPVDVLDGVDFELAPGEVVDIVGPSGSGKSTFLRVLARLLPQAEGHLELQGEPAESHSPQIWRSLVTLVPQKPAILDGSVRDNLLLPWRLKVRHGSAAPSDADIARALSTLALEVAIDRDAARLSVGQQARVALLRVLLAKPRVVLLDEVDAALDDVSAASVSAAVARFAEDGAAVVRVRHRADDGLAARRLRLEAGHLERVS